MVFQGGLINVPVSVEQATPPVILAKREHTRASRRATDKNVCSTNKLRRLELAFCTRHGLWKNFINVLAMRDALAD